MNELYTLKPECDVHDMAFKTAAVAEEKKVCTGVTAIFIVMCARVAFLDSIPAECLGRSGRVEC